MDPRTGNNRREGFHDCAHVGASNDAHLFHRTLFGFVGAQRCLFFGSEKLLPLGKRSLKRRHKALCVCFVDVSKRDFFSRRFEICFLIRHIVLRPLFDERSAPRDADDISDTPQAPSGR